MPRRRKDRIDDNQNEIVAALRKLPGVTVEPGHDDVLVGYLGTTYWFEIKRPVCLKKSGGYRKGAIKKHQRELTEFWSGHYSIVTTLDEILKEIGIT